MQRLKQNNMGANLRLGDTDLLIARGPVLPPGRKIQYGRFRIELNGYAERDHHEISRCGSVFTHWWTLLDPSQTDQIQVALREALAVQPVNDPDDPNGTYRTINFRAEGRVHRLWVEYTRGLVTAPFEAAWALLEQLFPTTLTF